jgi:hypothetical protein
MKRRKMMNLIDAKRELQQLENEEIYWLNEKENIKSLVMPKGIDITPDKISGGKREDRMLKYAELLDDKKIDETLDYIYKRKRNIMNYIENELKIVGEYSNLERKIYDLRYDSIYIKEHKGKKRPFSQISNITGYSSSQCCRILQKMLSRRSV